MKQRTIMVTPEFKVVLDVVLDLGDTIITSADDKIKMKGADLIWSNLANN